MKYPRKFGYVWKKNRVPQVSEKKPKHFELSVKKTKHLKTTGTGQMSTRKIKEANKNLLGQAL